MVIRGGSVNVSTHVDVFTLKTAKVPAYISTYIVEGQPTCTTMSLGSHLLWTSDMLRPSAPRPSSCYSGQIVQDLGQIN